MFIDSFIGYLKAEKHYSAHTLRAYEGDVRSFKEFVARIDESLSFWEADVDVVRSWVASMMDAGALPTSVGRRLSALRTFFTFLRRENVVPDSPAASLKGPKCGKPLPVFVRVEEMDRLIDEVDFGDSYAACRDKMILQFFYETGVRLSELVELNVSSVDMQACNIKVLGKRNRERVIPFARGLWQALGSYLAQRAAFAPDAPPALFLSDRGQRVSRSYVYRMVNTRLTDVTKLKKRSPHVLRHTFATSMLNNDAEIGAVKELLGHSRLATTEVYTHLTFEDLKCFYKKAHPRAGE